MVNFPTISPQLGIHPLAPGPTGLAAIQAQLEEQRRRNEASKTPDLSGLGKAIGAGYGLINGAPSGPPTPPLANFPDISSGAMEQANSALQGPTVQNTFMQDPSAFDFAGETADGTGAVDASLSTEGAGSLGESGVSSGAAEAGAEAGAEGGAEVAGQGLTGGVGSAGILAGAYTGYQQAKGVKDALGGKELSVQEQAALALPTFGASLIYNPVKRFFGSSKGPDQLARDQVRKTLQEKGAVDENFQITNPDGSKFDIGKDGNNKAYNVDTTKKDAPALIGLLNPAGFLVSGGNKKLNSDFTGYFTNAALESDDKLQAVRNIYSKLGITKDTAIAKINAAQVQGSLTKDEAAAYINSVSIVFSNAKQLPKAPEPTTSQQE